jgi:hypothetical protein
METLETLASEIHSLFDALQRETDPFKIYVLNCSLQQVVWEYSFLKR